MGLEIAWVIRGDTTYWLRLRGGDGTDDKVRWVSKFFSERCDYMSTLRKYQGLKGLGSYSEITCVSHVGSQGKTGYGQRQVFW